jgi:hypothetical protein
VLHTFHSLSVVALMANVVVAPLLPFAMAAGGLLILVADVEHLAIPASWLAWLAASGVLESVRFFAGLPGAWIATGAFPVSAMLGCYLAILLWVVQRSPELDRFQRVRPLLRGAAPMALLASLLSLSLSHTSDGQLTGELLDFGELMIAGSPSGKMLVMGTKVSPQVLTTTVAERLPFLKRSIDVLILSDDSAASWRGVEALAERYTLELLVTPRSASVSQPLSGVGRIVDASDEVRIDLGDNVIIQVGPQQTGLPNRSRLLPFALSYALTGIRFPDREVTTSPIEHAGWITVVRDGASSANALGAAAWVRWDSPNNHLDTGQGALELAPHADGPITFVSDGYRLTIRWSGCDGADSECTTVLGGAERQQSVTR